MAILCVELHRLEEVASHMRPAPGMHHLLASDFAVAGVTIKSIVVELEGRTGFAAAPADGRR